jgi:hypothetical protein
MWKRLFRPKNMSASYITIVSGLPRCGTSMMMQMLAAGGLEVLVDHIRQADKDNPNGYYELEKVKKIKEDALFIEHATGKVFKMVSLLLYDLPPGKQYKIIFMKRNLEEMLTSQRIMLQRNKKDPQDNNEEELRKNFENHMSKIIPWLDRQENMEVIYVNYNDVVKNPHLYAQAVNQFLSNRLDVQKMVEVVDQTLYRNRITST